MSGKTESLQQRSQEVLSQANHSSSIEDEATESEVETLKFEKGMKLKKKGMCYIIFFPQLSSVVLDLVLLICGDEFQVIKNFLHKTSNRRRIDVLI